MQEQDKITTCKDLLDGIMIWLVCFPGYEGVAGWCSLSVCIVCIVLVGCSNRL